MGCGWPSWLSGSVCRCISGLCSSSKSSPRCSWRGATAHISILANPFYAFFVVAFSIVLFGISVALTLPLIFVGMALLGLLGNNAVLILLEKFGIIKEARPKIP